MGRFLDSINPKLAAIFLVGTIVTVGSINAVQTMNRTNTTNNTTQVASSVVATDIVQEAVTIEGHLHPDLTMQYKPLRLYNLDDTAPANQQNDPEWQRWEKMKAYWQQTGVKPTDVECAEFVHDVFMQAGHPLPAFGDAIQYWYKYQNGQPTGGQQMPNGQLTGTQQMPNGQLTGTQQMPNGQLDGWYEIPNGTGSPAPGDIIVWGGGEIVKPYTDAQGVFHPGYPNGIGHVAIVVAVQPPANGANGSITFATANAPGNIVAQSGGGFTTTSANSTGNVAAQQPAGGVTTTGVNVTGNVAVQQPAVGVNTTGVNVTGNMTGQQSTGNVSFVDINTKQPVQTNLNPAIKVIPGTYLHTLVMKSDFTAVNDWGSSFVIKGFIHNQSLVKSTNLNAGVTFSGTGGYSCLSYPTTGGLPNPGLPAPADLPQSPDPNAQWVTVAQQDAQKYAQMYKLDATFVTYFVRQIKDESSFNPTAGSPAGAQGIAQFLPSRAKLEGIDPFNPTQALDQAAHDMAQSISDYSKTDPLIMAYMKAFAAYNGGPGAVQAAVAGSKQPGISWCQALSNLDPKHESFNYVNYIMFGIKK